MSIYKSLPSKNRPSCASLQATSSSRRSYLRYVFFALFAFFFTATLSYLATKNPTDSSATVVGFKPGNIMNDYTMGNYKTMTESEIQAFLTAKNPCKNTDYNKYQYLVNYYNKQLGKPASTHSWHFENGHFVCLSEERFGDGTEVGVKNGETAAHIIWQAAQDYRINPQVLIVLLEKEQGLVSDTFPRSGQYRSATGYGCPDTAACDSKYYGLKNQIRSAAALFRLALDGKSSYYPIGDNYVLYNPNKACGGSQVYIENRATGVLYRYTPYQPNAAALAAGTGTGNSCSSYGNRNFYHLFTSWFGSTQTEVPIARTRLFEDGLYEIVSPSDTTFSLAVKNNSAIMSTRQEDSQKWQLTYNDSDYTYTFIDPVTKLALGFAGAEATTGANLQISAANSSSCAQKWYMTKNKDNSYTLLSSCSTLMAASIKDSKTLDGVNVQIHDSDYTAAQKWRFIPEKSIEEGIYEISSLLGQGFSLDISGGTKNAKNGTNVQIYAGNQTSAQKWQLSYNSEDGTYNIVNPTTGLALDVTAAKTVNGTNIQVYSANSTCAQKWYIAKDSADAYSISSACSDLVLDVAATKVTKAANVQLYERNATKAQKWTFIPTVINTIEDGLYEIVPKVNNSLALDVHGGSANAKNGTNVQIYTQNHTAAQKWKLTHNTVGDTYTLTNSDTNFALDVTAAKTVNGTNIQVYSTNSTCAQKWYIEPSHDDFYNIFSSCNSNFALDVAGARGITGTNIHLYYKNGTNAQEWQLKKIEN